MKTNKFLIVLCALMLILPSCKLKKIVSVNYYYPPTSGVIPIYQTGQNLPENIIRIGSIVVGESGLTPVKDCTYEVCIRTIEEEARKSGADFIYLVSVKEPDWRGSLCYNITAEFYKYTNNQ